MRFALYYTPPPSSSLREIGSRWLGRDVLSGKTRKQSSFPGLQTERIDNITRVPRRYGLHATLKAPFSLADTCSEEELRITVETFVSDFCSFSTPPLILRQINDFFCLCPARHGLELTELADACVMHFDGFRAAMTQEELERRSKNKLTDLEKKYLITWGYPYVLDRFRFHITLTDRIGDSFEKERIHSILSNVFAPVLGKPLIVDALSLFIERAPGRSFMCMDRYLFDNAQKHE